MACTSTTSFGKMIELKIEEELLEKGCEVYVPLADDHGVDCIVKNSKGEFIEIQIKGRSSKAKRHGLFKVDDHPNPIKNFYFIFYSEFDDTTWIMSSKDLCKHTVPKKSKKTKSTRKIILSPENENFKVYINNYCFI